MTKEGRTVARIARYAEIDSSEAREKVDLMVVIAPISGAFATLISMIVQPSINHWLSRRENKITKNDKESSTIPPWLSNKISMKVEEYTGTSLASRHSHEIAGLVINAHQKAWSEKEFEWRTRLDKVRRRSRRWTSTALGLSVWALIASFLYLQEKPTQGHATTAAQDEPTEHRTNSPEEPAYAGESRCRHEVRPGKERLPFMCQVAWPNSRIAVFLTPGISGDPIGYLDSASGEQWFQCHTAGEQYSHNGYTSIWWARTQSDGDDPAWGYISEVYIPGIIGNHAAMNQC